jgi:hypothetical protein
LIVGQIFHQRVPPGKERKTSIAFLGIGQVNARKPAC